MIDISIKYSGTRLLLYKGVVRKKWKWRKPLDEVDAILSDAYLFGKYHLVDALSMVDDNKKLYFTYLDNGCVACDKCAGSYYIKKSSSDKLFMPVTKQVDKITLEVVEDLVKSSQYPDYVASIMVERENGTIFGMVNNHHTTMDEMFKIVELDMMSYVDSIPWDRYIQDGLSPVVITNNLFLAYTNRYQGLTIDREFDIPKHLKPNMTDPIRRGLIGHDAVLSVLDDNAYLVPVYTMLLSILYKRNLKNVEGTGLVEKLDKLRKSTIIC